MAVGKKPIENYNPEVRQNKGLYTKLAAVFDGNVTVNGTLSAGTVTETSQAITSASANAFAVGLTGATNPAFNVDASTASQVAGLNVKGAATGGTVAISTTDSGSNNNLTIDAKGTGTIGIGTNSTGNITIGKSGQNQAIIMPVASGNALVIGPNGATNPTLNVGTSTASAATGINIVSAAAGGGLAITTTSSGTDESLTIAAKGAGTITFNPAVVATANGAANDGIKFGSLGVGVFTGTGAPTFSAMNGSLYVDSNATTTTTRLYVNKSGAGTAGTTWTNFTAAA